MRRYRGFAWIVLVFVTGCGAPPAAPAGTGAREAAKGFFDAVMREDWSGAYASLDPESRKRHGLDPFTRLAKQYRRNLGLEPRTVYVRSCEEHGTEAVAHVTLAGRGAAGHGQYRDGVSLRRGEAGWAVVLPANFGQGKSR